MILNEKIVHIAGSASKLTELSLIEYGHSVVRGLVDALLRQGGRLLVQVGKEPLKEEKGKSVPLTFDWTVILEAHNFLIKNRIDVKRSIKKPLITVVKQDFIKSIPNDRKEIWEDMIDRGAVQIEFIEEGWSSGAIRRIRMSEYGDILVLIAGGEGVEHLAQEYNRYGKPIIPLDLKLGASKEDGSGGAPRLFADMLNQSEPFVTLQNKNSAGELFLKIETNDGTTPFEKVVEGIMNLIKNITPPPAFYVRLMAKNHPKYSDVENYLRKVVDPFLSQKGYSITEIGSQESKEAWMNVEIFERLHKAAIVEVDLTGLRPNCLLELGYALGRPLKVILTAKKGSKLPFDAEMFECLFWNPLDSAEDSTAKLEKYYNRNINRPPLIRTKDAL